MAHCFDPKAAWFDGCKMANQDDRGVNAMKHWNRRTAHVIMSRRGTLTDSRRCMLR